MDVGSDEEEFDSDDEMMDEDEGVPPLNPDLQRAYDQFPGNDDEVSINMDDLSDEIEDTARQMRDIEVALDDPKITKPALLMAKSQLPTLFGNLEDVQYELDGLELTTDEERARRKATLAELEVMFAKIHTLEAVCDATRLRLSEAARTLGNDLFKAGSFVQAIRHYDDAIALDSGNATLYTNRALARQKMDVLDGPEGAIADAKRAVTLDTGSLKGYIILLKCHLQQRNYAAATEVFGMVPLAYDSRPEVVELKTATAQGAKEAGNAALKEGKPDVAVANYSLAIRADAQNHLLYSNRSAAQQTRKNFQAALDDANAALELCPTFAKGYIHKARCLVQLKRHKEATAALAEATKALSSPQFAADLDSISPQMKEIAASIHQATNASSAPARPPPRAEQSDREKAEALKESGNAAYKGEDYQDAIKYYSQALSLQPADGSYYGNRAAAWLMMKEYKRAAADCHEGLKHEPSLGALDKLRLRHASALANMGDLPGAIKLLSDAVSAHPPSAASFDKVVAALQGASANALLGAESLEKAEFSRAKRLFQLASTGQASAYGDNPVVRLGIARCHLGLGEYEDASREAQKVISVAGGAGQVSVDAYLCRADALQATGATDLASKHLSAALQMDPDNQKIQIKLKSLRRVVAETTRVRGEIDEAMNKRDYAGAVARATDGLAIDKDGKKLISEMHYRRAFAYSKQAKLLARAPTDPAAATGTSAGASTSTSTSSSAAAGEEESPKKQADAAWRRVLQDCHASMYYDPASSSLSALFLKCEALQHLERFEEAVQELSQAYESGPAREDANIAEKLQEAKLALKKSKRVCLYALLGCGPSSSEVEIKKAYKKAALKWHPDRHSGADEARKQEVEAKFKEVNDAYELLCDAPRKKLWDQGYDRAEIEEKMEMEKQRQQYGGFGGHSHGHGHGHGHGRGRSPWG